MSEDNIELNQLAYSKAIENDFEKDSTDDAMQSDFVENQYQVINHIHNPTVLKYDKHDLHEIDKERVIKEFININKELALGNLDANELYVVREYNELISYEIRKGYWRIAASDIASVQTLLLASRSKGGLNLRLVLTKVVEKIFQEKKDKKPLMR